MGDTACSWEKSKTYVTGPSLVGRSGRFRCPREASLGTVGDVADAQAREAIVNEHMRLENGHDFPGCVGTSSTTPATRSSPAPRSSTGPRR